MFYYERWRTANSFLEHERDYKHKIIKESMNWSCYYSLKHDSADKFLFMCEREFILKFYRQCCLIFLAKPDDSWKNLERQQRLVYAKYFKGDKKNLKSSLNLLKIKSRIFFLKSNLSSLTLPFLLFCWFKPKKIILKAFNQPHTRDISVSEKKEFLKWQCKFYNKQLMR